MFRSFSASGLVVALLLISACSLSAPAATPDQPASGAPAAQSAGSPVPRRTPTPTQEEPALAPPPAEPGIPTVVARLDFSLPAGNGYLPQLVAVDGQGGRVYTFNSGLRAFGQGQGNTIGRFDPESAAFSALIDLNNLDPADSLAPEPLALLADPYRPRLYAIWGDRYGGPEEHTLTIFDAGSLAVVDSLPGVEAIAPGPDRLYFANSARLWAVDPESLAEVAARKLEPGRPQGSEPLFLSVEAGRLYLMRGRPWQVEAFAAGTLAPVGSYASTADELKGLFVDPARERLILLEKAGDELLLRPLGLDAGPLPGSEPARVPGELYGDLPVALTGPAFYLPDSRQGNYLLRAFNRSNLAEREAIDLPCRPGDLAADAGSGLIYAVCTFPDSVLLAIDPATGAVQTHYSALTVWGALAAPDENRLYVLDNAGLLRALDTAGTGACPAGSGDCYPEIGQVQTEFSTLAGYLSGAGELALDPARRRLYIGGQPAHVVDTGRLTVTARLDTPGQLTPDPTSDRLYLTTPCRCRLDQCNTLVLSAETLTGTHTLFPPQEPLVAPCVFGTQLDAENQWLYARINNGVAGSNAGHYYTLFDVSGPPREMFTAWDISFGDVAFDPAGKRAFVPRFRVVRGFIHRFEARGASVTQTLELAGTYGQLAYDPAFDRLYVNQKAGRSLQVFDGDLALLVEVPLPGEFDLVTADLPGQRLYLTNAAGELLVVATGGGRLPPAQPDRPISSLPASLQLYRAPGGALFRIDAGRLQRSDDGGRSWTPLGAGLPARPISAVAVSPDFEADQALFLGLGEYGWGGGLYRSTDGGQTWTPTTRGLTDLEIERIAVSPTFGRDQTLFVTTVARGLFRSTDGGDSWTALAGTYDRTSTDPTVDHLAISPTFADDGLLIINKGNLLRSTDGGDTWTDTGVPGGQAAFSPDFAADGLILDAAGWRSSDAGETWQPAAAGRQIAVGGARDVLFSPDFARDRTVYLLLQPDYDAPLTLQRSTDAGRSWQSLLGGLPSGFALQGATILDGGDLYLSAPHGRTMRIDPERLRWGDLPIDVAGVELLALAVAPDGALFASNGAAGVLQSVDGGRSWQEAGFPARTDAWTPIHLAPADDGSLFAAAGTALERGEPGPDGTLRWTHLAGLPVGFQISALAVSPGFSADGVILAGGNYNRNDILQSDDGGRTWETVFEGAELGDASDVAGFAFSPNFASDGTVYAWVQYGGLLRSTDGGRTWSRVLPDGPRNYFGQSLRVSPDGERVYLGALDGRLLVWEEGATGWLDLGANVPAARIWSSDLAFDAAGNLFLGTDVGVFRSTDGGQSWAAASAGLPLRPDADKPVGVRALGVLDDRLYAALVTGGVFVSADGGRTWQSTLTGEPASPLPAEPTPAPVEPPPATPAAVESPADCPTPPAFFADLWAPRLAQLGCPDPGGGIEGLVMVEQTFEGGRMFWRGDEATIYALPDGRPFAAFADTWEESQPLYSCPDLSPSQTPPTPQRGFGKVWCLEAGVRQGLGNATGQERAFRATAQPFDSGLIFQTDAGVWYVLERRSNSWERVE